ncbi:MAG: nitroreductase [Peptococcaceae bacterium]|nr:nitroreductase [Peptococcaceae bacterium]
MEMKKSVISLVNERFSCRKYMEKQISNETQRLLKDFLENNQIGPFGNCIRFCLIAATSSDGQELKGLGTYGVIKGAQSYIAGAMEPGQKNLEDFGYLMEKAILLSTDLGLGTCWLGGTFKKTSFAKKINLTQNETIPAIASVGYIADTDNASGWLGKAVSRNKRLPREQLFFKETFTLPLPKSEEGAYEQVLDCVRLAPSASNKQPWRIIKRDAYWHFYLQRTKGYGKDSFIMGKLLKLADLQRVDMGIAMCHFELAAHELGLAGSWEINEPNIEQPNEWTEYTASWHSRYLK